MGNLPNASITVKIIIFMRYILYEKFDDIWLITFKLGEYFDMGENFCVCQLASITICILVTYQFSLDLYQFPDQSFPISFLSSQNG